MMPVLDRVRESIKRDMQGVSKSDATAAAIGILVGIPGFIWIVITRWDSFLAYLSTL